MGVRTHHAADQAKRVYELAEATRRRAQEALETIGIAAEDHEAAASELEEVRRAIRRHRAAVEEATGKSANHLPADDPDAILYRETIPREMDGG